jgi:hypothetical protein
VGILVNAETYKAKDPQKIELRVGTTSLRTRGYGFGINSATSPIILRKCGDN